MAIGLGFVASSQCQLCDREGLGSSISAGTNTGWIRPYFDSRRASESSSISFKCRNPLFGGMQSYMSATGQDLPLSRVQVAADYSDSAPESSNFMHDRGYHPLEEVRKHEKNKDVLLTDVEIARTTVEANNKALLVFPGKVHCEPHGHVSWVEYQYVVDDYGDIFFELFDDESILRDRHANNPVTVLIGMDSSLCGENRISNTNYANLISDSVVDILLDDDYDEIVNTEVTDTLIKWGMPQTMRHIHPIYFSKCLAKSVQADCGKKIELPSNGISIVGCLRPAFIDEESYFRRLFHCEDSDGYSSDWRDESEKEEEQVAGTFDLIDGEILRFDRNRGSSSSTLYKLEIISIELFSIYGVQSSINLQDFQDAEPDVLAHSASAIIERFNKYGVQCSTALKTLCRKRKGLTVERASLIGVDSLGMDVKVSSGAEAQTLRFSFNPRATSESAAEKKIKRMLFPRYHRKSSRTPSGVKDLTSY